MGLHDFFLIKNVFNIPGCGTECESAANLLQAGISRVLLRRGGAVRGVRYEDGPPGQGRALLQE